MNVAVKAGRKSQRGNWLVVEMHKGEIFWCTWVRTWAGVQASRRHKEKYIDLVAALHKTDREKIGRVFVLDIERMLDFAVTEGADEINDLHKLWERS